MNAKEKSGLRGLGVSVVIAILGLSVMSSIGKVMWFTLSALIFGLLAVFSRMPARVGWIVITVASVICAAIAWPGAAGEVKHYAQLLKAKFAREEPREGLNQITRRAEASKSLDGSGSGVTISGVKSGPRGATQWRASSDGRVEGRAPEQGLRVVWTPTMEAGKVEWRCAVEPAHDFPPDLCNRIYQFD